MPPERANLIHLIKSIRAEYPTETFDERLIRLRAILQSPGMEEYARIFNEAVERDPD